MLKQATVGYGRRATVRVVDEAGSVTHIANPGLDPLPEVDRLAQTRERITYTETQVTAAIRDADTYRNPVPCESMTYELTGTHSTAAGRVRAEDIVGPLPGRPGRFELIFDRESAYDPYPDAGKVRRPIERQRKYSKR